MGQCLTPIFYRIIKLLSDSASVFLCAETVDSCVCVCAHLQRFYKKTAAFVMRAVAKHSPELSQAVVSSGGVATLVLCLEELDPGVKEAATWALSCIARHSERKGMLTSELADLLHLLFSHSSVPTQRCLRQWWTLVPSLCCYCASGSPRCPSNASRPPRSATSANTHQSWLRLWWITAPSHICPS